MSSASESYPLALEPRPLPYLPLEVKGHILRFCDPATLFATSLLSLAFLELSSPILYEDVTIRGVNQLEKLLCVDIKHPQPHLDSLLSLSLIRNLTYRHSPDESLSKEGRSRLSNPSRFGRTANPLLLNKFHLVITTDSYWRKGPADIGGCIERLFRYFSPASFVLEGVLPDGAAMDPSTSLPLISFDKSGHWTRLEDIAFINGFPSSTLALCSFFAQERSLSVGLTYDVSELVDACADRWLRILLEDLRGEDEEDTLDEDTIEHRLGMIRELEVVVGAEERKTSVLEGLAGLSILARTKVVVRARA